MSNFTLYKSHSSIQTEYEYLLNVQSSLLDDLKSRLVIPLIKKPFRKSIIQILNPEIEIDNTTYIILTQQMASVPINYLGKLIENIEINRTEVLSAIDFLITGY